MKRTGDQIGGSVMFASAPFVFTSLSPRQAPLETGWAFLEPWRETLCSALAPSKGPFYTGAPNGVSATFKLYPSKYKEPQFRVSDCTLCVEFPADQASRQDGARLQRLREAIEIFDRLSAVNNAVFVTLLAKAMEPDQRACQMPVWPTWKCTLSEPLAPDDSAAIKSCVTWAELLGCPADPWEYSPEFRDVMEKLQTRGVMHTGIRHNKVVTASWLVKMKKLWSRGDQTLTDEKNATPTADPLARELGKLLGLMAPSIVHVHSVRDSSALTETWRETTTPMRAGALDDSTTVCCREFSSPEMLQTAAALCQTNTNSVSLYLEDSPNGNKADFAQGGSFMSSLVSGRSTCRSNVGAPELERKARLEHLAVVYETVHSFRNGAILSAFADASSIDRLTLVKAANDKHDACLEPLHWGWLAYALWGRTSTVSIPTLRLSPMDLTEELVSAVEAALQTNYPQPQRGSASLYGFVDILEGTELRPCRRSSLALVLSRDCRCRAYYDPSSMGSQANVVVPGYGICQVELEEGTIEFVSDEASTDITMQEATGSGGVRSLIVDFWRLEDDALVTRLLRLIGRNLKSLALDFSETSDDVEVDLSEVAVACPMLKELRLEGCNASISTHNEALRNWGIKKLEIYESRAVDGLETLLSDQSYRTARGLVELAFSAPPDSMNEHFFGFSYHGMPAEDNRLPREYVSALMAHRGELVIKEKFPVRPKLAMLSPPDSSLRSMQYMDSSILSRIFAFAAVPAQRSVDKYDARVR